MTLVPDDSKPQPPGLFDRARLPVAFLLVCVFVLGGYYFLHVESKSSYLMGRNFRLLATMGGGIKMSLESYGQVFGSYARDLKGSHGHLPQEFFNCGRHQEVPKNAVHPDGEPLIFLAEQPIDHLVFAHFAEPVVSEHAVLSCDLSLQTLLAPLFDSKEAFDVVLLVEPDGDVVYQHGGPELGVTRLPLDSGQPAQKAGAKAAVVPSLLSSSVDRNVVLGGREYKLFAEPLRLPIANPEGSVTPWFLCGLVAADKFVSKSLAVSSSLLLSILAALLLLALSWPLIKLRLLGERQRVRLLDVLLLGGCSLLGVAILTLSLLDFYAYREFESTAAGQLHDFALKMAANVETEISAARRDLALLEARAASLSAAQEDASRGSGMSSRVPLSITPSRDWINFSLIDREGMQQVKWTPPDGPLLPKVYVRDRSYFQHALSGETGTRPAAAGGFVEAVMAWTSRSRFRRSREAVLAVPVSNPSLLDQGFAVATLAMPMHSVIGPLTPPGFEFAVIDDQGEVLFHANPSRNGVENFFAETDGDPHLRSAVFARHAEEMEVHYFGEDYMAAVQPVAGLPWTVVALRSKEMLRSLNMDWLVTTLLFLLLLALCPLAVVLLLLALVRPRYRAPWMWPDPARATEYVNLAALLAFDCLAFGLAIYLLPAANQVLGIAAILPFLALGTSYAMLARRQGGASAKRTSAVLALCFLGASIGVLVGGHEGPLSRGEAPAAALVLVACLLSALRPEPWMRRTSGLPLPVGRAYPLAALLLLMLTIVLPTAGVFASVHRIELDSFVRHGQLKLARGWGALHRSSPGPSALDYYGGSFFATRVEEVKELKELKGVKAECLKQNKLETMPLPEFLEDLLPNYSSHSSEMRELLHGRASDCSWDSHRGPEGEMKLHSRIDGLLLTSTLSPPAASEDGVAKAGFFSLGEAASWAGALPGAGLAGLFCALLYGLVLFISRRLFLLGLLEPVWAAQETSPALIAGRNLFLVSKVRISSKEARKAGFDLVDLGRIDPGAVAWAVPRRDLVDSGRDVLVVGFEHGIYDPASNSGKLALLDELAELRQRTIVVLSRVSPRRLLEAQKGDAARPEAARWRSLLSSFTVIEEDFRCKATRSRTGGAWALLAGFLPPRHRAVPPPASPAGRPVLEEESGDDPFLLKIARGLEARSGEMDREQLLEEFSERAEGHYREVWESCSLDEKVVLQHLAEEGLVNERSRRVIRRLMACGLIRREPNFCLMNETFRRFVASPFCRRQVDVFEQQAKPSAWDRFRWPFLCVLAASLAFFFATQQELLNSTIAVVTGLAAGLPALAKIVDLLGGKRSAPAKAG